jgi:ribosomal-protein-serine acetyltransferase
MNDLLSVEPNLELQSPRPKNAGALLSLIERNHDHLKRYLPKVTEIDSLEKAEAHIAHCLEQREAKELFEFHVFQGGALCGVVRLNYFEWESKKAAIAYFLDADFQGRGIITKAARAVLEFGFVNLELHRIELRCVTTNTGSVRIAERLGFKLEGELRDSEWLDGRPVNHFVYGLLRHEFKQT